MAIFMIFILPFAFLALIGFGCWRESRRACRWPCVRGRITKSELRTRIVQEGVPLLMPDTFVHAPLIIYSYEVDGKVYRSTRLSFVYENLRSKRCADGALQRYPRGQKVAVHYDPDDPRDAILDPEMSSRCGLVVATMAIVAGLLTTGLMIFSLMP